MLDDEPQQSFGPGEVRPTHLLGVFALAAISCGRPGAGTQRRQHL